MSSWTRSGDAESPDWRGIWRDAIRSWETRRIAYNLMLTLVVVTWLVWTWPHFQPAMELQSLYALSVLAILANLCYCAAYVPEIAVQPSSLRGAWRRGRWMVWLAGMVV